MLMSGKKKWRSDSSHRNFSYHPMEKIFVVPSHCSQRLFKTSFLAIFSVSFALAMVRRLMIERQIYLRHDWWRFSGSVRLCTACAFCFDQLCKLLEMPSLWDSKNVSTEWPANFNGCYSLSVRVILSLWWSKSHKQNMNALTCMCDRQGWHGMRLRRFGISGYTKKA